MKNLIERRDRAQPHEPDIVARQVRERRNRHGQRRDGQGLGGASAHFRPGILRQKNHFIRHPRRGQFAGHPRQKLARFSQRAPQIRQQCLRLIHVATHQGVRDRVGGNLEAADHVGFDDGFGRFREARPAEGLHGGHASVELPVVQRFRERDESPPACASRQAPASRGAGSIHVRHALVRCSDRASRSCARTPADRPGPYRSPRQFPESRSTARFRTAANYFATLPREFLLSRFRAIGRES